MINWLKDKIMIKQLLVMEKDYLKYVVKFPSVMGNLEINMSPKKVLTTPRKCFLVLSNKLNTSW